MRSGDAPDEKGKSVALRNESAHWSRCRLRIVHTITGTAANVHDIEEAPKLFHIKGKKYIASPYKYYYTDPGLRNARLYFRQQEENHIMENIIYNELRYRGFNVDVGIVSREEKNSEGKRIINQYEVDFVCNKGSKRYYIQSAFAMPDAEKINQEQRSLLYTGDFFKKNHCFSDNIFL